MEPQLHRRAGPGPALAPPVDAPTPPRSLWASFRRPGALAFATLFAIDSLSRASLIVILPLEALRLTGNARDVSILYTIVGIVALVLVVFLPLLLRRLRGVGVYALGAAFLLATPVLLATSTLAGFGAAILLRQLGAGCLIAALQLFMMAYIDKHDLIRAEPLRNFAAAGAWTVGPTLGAYLFESVSPWAAYALSGGAALVLMLYVRSLGLDRDTRPVPGSLPRINPWPAIRRYVAQPRLRLAWVLNYSREIWWLALIIYSPIYMATHGVDRTVGSLMVSTVCAYLFFAPLSGRLGRRFGLRRLMFSGYLFAGVVTSLALIDFERPAWVAAILLVGGLGVTVLDSTVVVTFLRAVHARERPEMTMVFSTYRDGGTLLTTAVFSVLLSFLDLWSVFAATGVALMGTAWLALYLPRRF